MATFHITKHAALLAVAAIGPASPVGPPSSTHCTEGRAPRAAPSARPAVEAAFPRESYAPGETARLVLSDGVPHGRVRVFRAGTERVRIGPRDVMLGTPVTPVRQVTGRRIAFRIGAWPSGLYFARVQSRARVGFAPFVVRPGRLGESRIAVVMPTLTWQAYNFRDDDGDGDEDTWYATRGATVRLGRPFENRGVPPHYKHYDQPFLRWLREAGLDADYLAQSDLEATSGRALAAAYDLIVFPGHHEYVTTREYDAVESFRDRGGNLMFLSANNFFWKVERHNGVLHRIAKWRDLGRPEASLVGVQYIGNDEGEKRGAWIVKPAGASHWAFEGVGVRAGSAFSNGGIEIDKKAASSPRSTVVLAEIRDLLGPGMTGQMTYYETARGAKVFAAGAFTLAGAIRQPAVRRLVANLWARLGSDRGGRFLAASRSGYGWPVKPFDAQHPVRGYFGDPRIGGHGSKQFHFGVDVSAPNGTAVYATITGTVSFLHEDAISVAGAGGVAFEYWHIVPTVRPGAHVVAYRTVIGHVEKPWAHVHFSERRNGVYVNPLRRGAMRPFVDDAGPTVHAIGLRGGVLTADVADETPLTVPAPWSDLPVMPNVVRWRVAGGAWKTAADFRVHIPSANAFHVVYAPATRQNHARTPGLYRVRLASGLSTRRLAGRTLEVEAIDQGGNRAQGTVSFGR